MIMFQPAYLAILSELIIAVWSLRIPSPSLLVTSQHNSSLPFNLTLAQTWLNALPPDPFSYPVIDSDVTVKFHSYGPQIDKSRADTSLYKALEDVLRHSREFDDLINRNLEYNTEDVFLTLYPGRAMTWIMWSAATRGLADFLEKYDAVVMVFDILMTAHGGRVGFGTLVSI